MKVFTIFTRVNSNLHEILLFKEKLNILLRITRAKLLNTKNDNKLLQINDSH